MKNGIQQWLQKEKLQLNVDQLQKKQLQRERQLLKEKPLQREQQQKKQLLKEKPLQRERQLLKEKPLQSEDDNPSKIMSRLLETICFPFSNFQFKNDVIFTRQVLNL